MEGNGRRQTKIQTEDEDLDDISLRPYMHILQAPGKQIRSKLLTSFNLWLKVPDDKLAVVADIILLLHNSSLLIDDVQDNSTSRRGIPAAHLIYGVASTINAANHVYLIALQNVLSLGHPEATSIYTEQLLKLHHGQGLEIYWRDNYLCPSEEEYRKMIMCKTGGLFMLAIQLIQLFSDNKTDFQKLIGIFSLYFQIRDDYCNLNLKEYHESKSYCEDFTEGKFSFPIIHAIHNRPEDKQLLSILRQRTQDVGVKRYCVKLLERFGSFQYTHDVLVELDKQAREEIENLGGNAGLIAILDGLYDWNKDIY